METVYEEAPGQRLDKFMLGELEDISRSRIAQLIKEGYITVNGKEVKTGYSLAEGDVISWELPEEKTLEVKAENIPLDIYYEDSDVLVVNKPRGMVVHPAPGAYEHTLVNALMFHCKDLSGINGVLRPGIVHRIDKDTSGLLLVAKNDFAHKSLAEQLKEHSVKRIYTGILCGVMPEPSGIIRCPIGRHPVDRKKRSVVQGGKNAVTHYRVTERFKDYTLMEARLETGRTHQIRVHMKYLGFPLLGDPLYGKGDDNPFAFGGQALHAGTIGFIHPVSGEYLEFSADLPSDMQKVLDILRKNKA